MTTMAHMCLDIEGFLDTYKDKPLTFFNGMAKKEDGSKATGAEYIAYLQNHLAQGHKVVPFGNCPDFDYETGCPGHPADIVHQIQQAVIVETQKDLE